MAARLIRHVAVDEPKEQLCEALQLPEFLEERRPELQTILPHLS